MSTEIERKFLVDTAQWKPRDAGTPFRQGYLSSHAERVVRVRLEGDRAKLTIKGPTRGVTRTEVEYDIPREDADRLLELCERPLIEKTRYLEEHAGLTWEIDVFHGANAGLVVAEVELEREDQTMTKPAWATIEVSEDPRYFNANLIHEPYSSWKRES